MHVAQICNDTLHKFVDKIILSEYIYHNNLTIFFNFLINQFLLLCHIYVHVWHVCWLFFLLYY